MAQRAQGVAQGGGGAGELPEETGRRCSKCKQRGHTIRTCGRVADVTAAAANGRVRVTVCESLFVATCGWGRASRCRFVVVCSPYSVTPYCVATLTRHSDSSHLQPFSDGRYQYTDGRVDPENFTGGPPPPSPARALAPKWSLHIRTGRQSSHKCNGASRSNSSVSAKMVQFI